MSLPICEHCRAKPVNAISRRYCSRRCCCLALRAKTAGTRRVNFMPMVKINRQSYLVRTRERLLEEARTLMDSKPTPAMLARFIWNAELRGYRRGFSAAWMERRRKALAS